MTLYGALWTIQGHINMDIIQLDDQLSFAIIIPEPHGYNEQVIELRERYGAGGSALTQSKRHKSIAFQMALMGWVEQNVIEKNEAVLSARELDANCDVSSSATNFHVEIVVSFSQRDAAALFKLTWVGTMA